MRDDADFIEALLLGWIADPVIDAVITSGGTNVFSGTAATLAGSPAKTLTALAAGASSDFTFAVTLDASAGNTYQGLGASLPLTWTFAS